MLFAEVLNNLYNYELNNLKYLMSERKKYKTGTLIIRNRNGRFYYSEKIRGVEKGITKDRIRTEKVIRNNYLKREIDNTKVRLEALSYAMEKIRILENPLIEHSTEYNKIKCRYSFEDWQWMHEEYETNPLHPEHLQYVTGLGVRVRSKSELAIANALERNGIPYRYEMRVDLDGKTYYPDFVIKKTDSTLIIWEHVGAVHIEGYLDKTAEKIKRYEAAGYHQHTNLICTYESNVKSQEDIDKIIQRLCFIQRRYNLWFSGRNRRII